MELSKHKFSIFVATAALEHPTELLEILFIYKFEHLDTKKLAYKTVISWMLQFFSLKRGLYRPLYDE